MNEAHPGAAPRPLEALREARRRAFHDLRGHLVYGILAAAAGAFVLAPAGSWLVMRAIKTAGGSVVNTELARFALSLPGLLVFVLWTSLIGVVVVVNGAGHAYLAASSALGRHPTIRQVVREVGADLLRVPGRGGARLALLAALGVPVLGSVVTALARVVVSPIKGIVDLRNLVPRGLPVPLWMVGAGMAVAFVLFGWLYVRWSLAIAALTLEGVPLTEGVRRSVRRVRGNFWRIAAAHLVHHVTISALFALLILVFRLAGRPLLEWLFARSEEQGAVGLAVLLALFSALGGLLGIFGIARLASLTVVHHAALGGALEHPGSAHTALSRRLRLGGVLLALGSLVALAVTVWLALPKVRAELERATHPTSVAAHRCGATFVPENTLAALRYAIDSKADWGEIDVQQAKDGTLVVVHDSGLKRVGNLDRDVGLMTAAELAEVDVGSHFSPAFRDERIPTFERFLDAARDRLPLAIEPKANGHENAEFIPDFVAMLQRKGFVDQCAVISLEARFLAAIRKLEPRLRLGLIITAKVGTAADLDVDFYAVQPLVATSEFIRDAHREGREVWVWTVNDRSDMARLADRAADTIITDDPRAARAVLDARTTADGVRAAARRLFRLD